MAGTGTDPQSTSRRERRPVRVAVSALSVITTVVGVACTAAPSPRPWIPEPWEGPNGAVEVGETVQVVPGPGVPSDAPLLPANNNLDVIDVDGTIFLAFRTSLVHFASPFTRIIVLRSDDRGTTWETDSVIERGVDLREPRFLALDGRLFLYFFEAGVNPIAFEPGRILAMHRESDGTWVDPRVISPDDYVVWRTRTLDGVPYMVRYRGGGDSYSAGEASIEVELLTTTDGYEWTPVDPDRPVVHTGGAGETDIAFDPDGRLWAVMRNEAGENGTFGSLVCTAPPADIGDWDCSPDPRKYDSPLVFAHEGDIWMLARRQVANEGRYDLGFSALPRDAALLAYQAAYWVTPKRLALWRIDTENRRVEWVLDLPSRGDTAFPGIVWNGPHHLDVYNYSSPVDGPDLPWVSGQLGPTHIYRTSLVLPS